MNSFDTMKSLFARAKHSLPNGTVWLAGLISVMLGIAVADVPLSTPLHAGAAASKPDASSVARARAAFIKAMSARRPNVRSTLAPLASNGGAASAPSLNWSGYAVSETGGNTVSLVSGDWVIPQVDCPNGQYKYADLFYSQWVGIDGYTDGTVEQLGSSVECFEGVPYYYVWYEMFPAGTVEEGTVACINNNVDCPQPGDHVSASVTATGGNYTLTLTDHTRPQESFSVTASCAPTTCTDTSAEWIVERPAFDLSFGFQILPLAAFWQADFTNGKVTSGGKTTYIEGFKDGPIYDIPMIDDTDSYFLDCVGQRSYGQPELLLTSKTNSCPTLPTYKGSFTVAWDAAF
jgi:hypothetical protein